MTIYKLYGYDTNSVKCYILCFRSITDVVFKSSVTICASSERKKTVFTSNGHVVDITLPALSDPSRNFLLKYEGNVTIAVLFRLKPEQMH